MTLLAPLALAALLVPLAIYVVHWLFGARKRVRVSAVFLWNALPQARTGRSRRRIPPLSWLLALQLLAALLGVAALARPSLPADPPRHLALILDASATMQATDVAPSRFEAARRAALQRIDGLRSTDLVSVIRAGKQASFLASGPPASVKASLQAAAPGQSAPAIRDALAMASARVAATPERLGHILLVTDVAWPQPDPLGPLAAPVEIQPVGGGSENQALTAFVVRIDPTGRGQTAFVEIANESDYAARVPMSITADGAPLDQRQIDIAPRTRAHISIPVPMDAHRLVARLLSKDALALDDVMETIAPGGPTRQVDLLGPASDGVRRAIESVPSLHIRSSDAATPPDLTVLAGVLPARLPTGPLLLIDPPSNSARLLGVGLGSAARVQPEHPLLQGLDLVALQDETPSVAGVPGWAHVVLGTHQGPLIMEGRLENHPVVSLTFDPTTSGLEKSLAFPLLIGNATSFLLMQADNPTRTRAVELDIAPRPLPTFDSAAPAQDLSAGSAQLEVWPWLAAAGLAILSAEWLVFARRG